MGVDNIKPFLKWVGGKQRLLPDLEEVFNRQNCTTFVDSFVGAGSVFMNFANRFERIIINDINPKLINCYIQIRDNLDPLLGILSDCQSIYLKEDPEYVFDNIKLAFNGNCSPLHSAAFLIFLNKTCFNGLYRENKKGEFNVAFGKRPDARIFDEDDLRNVSSLLQRVEIYCGSYHNLEVSENTFVYLDPPYMPTSTGHTKYTKDEFGWAEHLGLASYLKQIDEKGIKFACSNSAFLGAKSLYSDFSIQRVCINRLLAPEGDSRSQDSEIIVTNF